jgi:hypothetical protein
MRASLKAATTTALALSLVACNAARQDSAPTGAQAPASAPAPAIDPKAADLLEKTCSLVASMQSFAVTTTETHDRVKPSGEKVPVAFSREMVVRRPDKLWIRVSGAKSAGIWYDGSKLSMKADGTNMYAQADMPPTLDEALDFMAARGHVRMPMADLLYSDPYASYIGPETKGRYVGLEDVDGTRAHHLEFADPALDFDIWIQSEGQPLPKKLSLHYKAADGKPVSTITFTSWEPNPPVRDGEFTFTPAAGDVHVLFAGQKHSQASGT